MKSILLGILVATIAVMCLTNPVGSFICEHKVRISAYAPVKRCTKPLNSDVTSSGLKLKQQHSGQIIALSRDLAKWYKFGDTFKLVIGDNIYIVTFQDKMHGRKRNSVDLMFYTVKQCKEFGLKEGYIEKISVSSRF